VSLPGRERWRNAAAAMTSYRARWGTNPTDAVNDSSGLPDEQAAHLAQVNELVAATIEPADASNEVPGLGVE
jgi:hypothetical protein